MDNMQIVKDIRIAIKKGYTEEVVKLIGNDKTLLNYMTAFGTWLHVAATFGKLDIVKKLLELGADINMQGGIFKGSALNEASTEGKFEIVQYLISCGAEIDVSDPEKNPLFGAILSGSLDIAKLLIERGIDISVKYNGKHMSNMDALAFAIERGQNEIADLLRAKS